MTKRGTTRHGSLQFYPRVRAKKVLPRVNWNSFSNPKEGKGLLGFIGYKAGMASAYVKDNTANSLTKGQRIIIPVTIIEFPTIKIFSVRFYKDKKVMGEVLNSGVDKEMKNKTKIPKEKTDATKDVWKSKIEGFVNKNKGKFDDVRIIVYSQVKKTDIKKTPDIAEIGLSGSLDEKINFVKESLAKEIHVKDFLTGSVMKEGLVDIRGVTKGKGNQGPAKRFGLTLRAHKSEKGVRGPGSGGAWHPARVEFTQPMAGQMGYFTRVVYNNKLIKAGEISEGDINPKEGFKHYGKIKNDYAIVFGSLQGPVKRQIMITPASRPTKNQSKKNFEFLELR